MVETSASGLGFAFGPAHLNFAGVGQQAWGFAVALGCCSRIKQGTRLFTKRQHDGLTLVKRGSVLSWGQS